MATPNSYPTKNKTDSKMSAPIPPDGRCITDSKMLHPCKLSFSFLRKAFDYAKYQYIQVIGHRI
jgi:hypothetical protein